MEAEGETGAAPPAARGETRVAEPTRLERGVARGVAEAKATVPHLYAEVEASLDSWGGDVSAGRVRHADLAVWGAARALREWPRLNGAYRDGRFESYSRVNVGIVAAAESAFAVPTIFDADRLTPGEVATAARELERRALEGAITQPELSGGTFTVSAPPGEALAVTPVVHRGQAAILGVGAPAERAVARHGEVAVVSCIRLVLACDHRIVTAADAAGFLTTLKRLLEAPPDSQP